MIKRKGGGKRWRIVSSLPSGANDRIMPSSFSLASTNQENRDTKKKKQDWFFLELVGTKKIGSGGVRNKKETWGTAEFWREDEKWGALQFRCEENSMLLRAVGQKANSVKAQRGTTATNTCMWNVVQRKCHKVRGPRIQKNKSRRKCGESMWECISYYEHGHKRIDNLFSDVRCYYSITGAV